MWFSYLGSNPAKLALIVHKSTGRWAFCQSTCQLTCQYAGPGVNSGLEDGESNPVSKERKDMQLHSLKSKIHHVVRALDPDILIDPLYFDGRNSSVGRALDWRSKGPWFNPGFRQCRNTRRSSDFSIGESFYIVCQYILQMMKACVALKSDEAASIQDLLSRLKSWFDYAVSRFYSTMLGCNALTVKWMAPQKPGPSLKCWSIIATTFCTLYFSYPR